MPQGKKELALTDDSPSGTTLPSPPVEEETETKSPPPSKGEDEPSVPSPVAIAGPAGNTAALATAGPACSMTILSDVSSLDGSLVPPPPPRLPLRKTAMAAGVKRKLEREGDVEAGGGGGGKKQRALAAASAQGHESAVVSALSADDVEVAAGEDAHPPAPEYSFTVDPLMGGSFQVQLAPDASMFDLKDAIFTKTGVVHEMQLLGHSAGTVDFDNEEVFLDETSLPSQCRLSLSVRAATGKPLASRREEVGVEETEGYFVAELLLPADSSGSDEEGYEGDGTGEESEAAAGEDKEGRDGEQGQRSPSKRPSLLSSPKWTTTTTAIPLADLASYLGGNPLLSSGDELLHRDLASLRIEIVPVSEESERPTSPAVEAAITTTTNNNSPMGGHEGERETTPPLVAPQNGGAPPHRCQQCGVRCRLAQQFRCKCGSMFCPQHRFADQHGCRFDHKNFDRQRLQVANPKVCAPQVADL